MSIAFSSVSTRPLPVRLAKPPACAPRFGNNRSRTYRELDDPGRTDQYAAPQYPAGCPTANPFLQNLLAQHLSPGDIVLELGCNSGNNLLPLADKFQVYGVDITQAAIRRLQRKAEDLGMSGKVNAALWDFAEDGALPPEWPSLEGRCKAIYAVHVMSHFPKQPFIQAMQDMRKYLAPGGRMIISVIDPSDDPGEKQRWADQAAYYGGETLAGFNVHGPKTLEKAFAGLDFLPEESRPFERGELKYWILPEKRLRWLVYQKPPETA